MQNIRNLLLPLGSLWFSYISIKGCSPKVEKNSTPINVISYTDKVMRREITVVFVISDYCDVLVMVTPQRPSSHFVAISLH